MITNEKIIKCRSTDDQPLAKQPSNVTIFWTTLSSAGATIAKLKNEYYVYIL